MGQDVLDEFEISAGLRKTPWTRYDEPARTNPKNTLCSIRAFYWERPATSFSTAEATDLDLNTARKSYASHN
jgi:hypothetical protein